MISVDEALDQILKAAKRLPASECPLPEAAGRVLAKPVIAQTTQPRFDASAMDGYAVRAADVAAGTVLQQTGVAQAGAGFAGKVGSGECVRIYTGAPVPEGADAVVMQEQTLAEGASIRFEKAALPGQNIRTKGREFSAGAVLLSEGEKLTPAAVMLAAAANNAQAEVYAQPKLALLATGDELVPPGSPLGPGQIAGSNSLGLAALFAPFCADVNDHGIAADDEEALRGALKAVLDSDADVVVTTGGASVGDLDLVQPVLKSLGVDIGFWKIAMRPGKPLMFGTLGDKLVFGLPGNPVSAVVTAVTVVLPVLRYMAGHRQAGSQELHLPLTAPVDENGSMRRHFLRGVIGPGEDGGLAVTPIQETDSAHLSSLASANALIVHAEHAPAQPAGALVPVIPLPWGDICAPVSPSSL